MKLEIKFVMYKWVGVLDCVNCIDSLHVRSQLLLWNRGKGSELLEPKNFNGEGTEVSQILYSVLVFDFINLVQIASSPQTCPADDVSSKCGSSDEWEGEFFPGIPKIKYEVKQG